MADNEPKPPGPLREIPPSTPRSHPPTISTEPDRTLGDDPVEGYEILTAPSQTSPFPNTPTAPDPPEVPAALADHPRYRVVRWLGSGGMGSVFLAEHRLMERPVALKLINRDLTDHAGAVERFGREVRAAARLQHPHIVTAFDAEQAGPVHFLVMEFVEGTDLARLVKRTGPLPVNLACDAARQAALGLQHAHEHGMVHRDIKPQNLMRTRRGQVKILDFGLALFASEVESAGGFTGTGAMLGTADYVAPEQADDAHSADTRADIYSLGCTLYFLLAGHPPFPGGSLLQKLSSHSRKKPRSLSEIRTDLPRGLEQVLDRMMAKDPNERYSTPAEVAGALAPFAGTSPPDQAVETPGTTEGRGRRPAALLLPPPPDGSGESRPRRRFRTSVLATLALLMVGGLLGLAASRTLRNKPEPIIVAHDARPTPPMSPTIPVDSPPDHPMPPSPPPVSEKTPVVPIMQPTAEPVPNAPVPAAPVPYVPNVPMPRVPSPDEILRGKGLTRVNLIYRLESEARVESEFQALKMLQGDLLMISEQLDQVNKEIDAHTTALRSLNLIPSTMPLSNARNKTESEAITQANNREFYRVADAQRQAVSFEQQINILRPDQQRLAAQFEVKKYDFQLRTVAAERSYNAMMAQYAALANDPEVRTAINALNKTANPKVVLGPVRNKAQYVAQVAANATQVLRLKGLVPPSRGVRFLLESELMARDKDAGLQLALRNLKKAEAAPRSTEKREAELQAQRKKLSEDLGAAVLPQRKAVLKAQLDAKDREIVRARMGPAAPDQDSAGPDLRAELLQAVVDLRKAAEAVRAQREAALADDPEVKDALAELNKGKRETDRFRIASSPEADAALELLEETQKAIGLQVVPVRIDAGARVIDASLNGGPASAVVLDPKAVGLRLSAAMAASVGVEPAPDSGVVTIKKPDGQSISARQATLRGLKLGPVVLANVPCLILPREAGDPPPSLGTRSAGDFALLLAPDGSKLYVARVEALLENRP